MKIMYFTLKQALVDRGYIYREISLGKQVYREYTAPNGWIWLSTKQAYDYPFISVPAFKISKNKALSNSFVEHLGIPIPPSLQTESIIEAEEFLEKFAPIIVKPVSSSGSKGLTLNVIKKEQLRRAIDTAARAGQPPLLQKQFEGEEVRLTIINGRVCSAILRQTPRLIGDGISTLEQLLYAENKIREDLVFPTLSYPELSQKIVDFKTLNMSLRPNLDEVIELSRATMIRQGASFYGVLDKLHVSYIEVAEKLAAALNPEMLVVDLLVHDYKMQASDDNYIFLEFNTAPGLEIYTSLRGGDTPDVIKLIADMVEKMALRSEKLQK